MGAVLTPRLLAEGYRVRVLDSFMFNQNSLLDCCHDPKLEIIRGDVRDESTMREALQDVNFIIHLAAIVGAPLCDRDPIAARTTNVDAVKLLLSLRDERPIISPCTNSGYGVGQMDTEGKLAYCTEETPLNPVSLYGRLKVEGEELLMERGNAISLRLATVFGASPRMRLDLLVNNLVWRAVKDGYVVLYQSHFKRNFIHVRDVAKAFLHCLKNWETVKNEVYNVGLSSANLSKLELCEEIKKQVPDFYFIEAPVGRDIDQRNYVVSNQKFESTGWKPDYSLANGITELRRAYMILDKA